MGQELTLPTGFAAPSKLFAQAGFDPAESLAEGIGQSYAVLGYKGGRWSLRYRGDRFNFIRPDDGTPLTYLDVIIMGQAKVRSKSFYKKYDPNGSSEGERPLCSSMDGIKPDADVTQRQAEICALCPRNEWKMLTKDDGTTRKGRECQDYKRLAVLVLPPLTAALFQGTPLLEPVFLRVPPASLNSLAIMGDTMSAKGYHFANYITRITFNPEVSWPELVFQPIKGLADAEVAKIIEMMQDNKAIIDRITGGEPALEQPGTATIISPSATPAPTAQNGATLVADVVSPSATPSTLSTQQTSGSAPAPSVIDLPPPTTVAMPAPQPAPEPSRILASAPPATPVAPPVSSPSTETTEQGALFSGVIPAAQPQVAQPTLQPAPQTPADTGEVSASDAELDAAIMAVIKRGKAQ